MEKGEGVARRRERRKKSSHPQVHEMFLSKCVSSLSYSSKRDTKDEGTIIRNMGQHQTRCTPHRMHKR